MRGEFTSCVLRRDRGPEIPAGAFLLGQTIAYRVDRVQGRQLHCTRWPLDEVPDDALTFDWMWTARAVSQPGPNVENIRSSGQAKRGVEPIPKGQRRR